MRRIAGLCAVAMVLSVVNGSPAARAEEDVTVTVMIEGIETLSCLDGTFGGTCSGADFYAAVTIDGARTDNRESQSSLAFANQNSIQVEWPFSRAVEVEKEIIPIRIEIFDRDSFGVPSDDRLDVDNLRRDPDVPVTPQDQRDLNVTVDLAPCYIAGDVNGSDHPRGGCNKRLESAGAQSDAARVKFRITLSTYPVQPAPAPGGHVRCLHSPIWPQAGEAVTIRAESLTSDLQARLTLKIEIWLDRNGPTVFGFERTELEHVFTPSGPFSYLCRLLDEGVDLRTSARAVHVGPAGGREAVPVLITGSQRHSVDLVFVPDADDYTGGADPTFITAVGDTIRRAYFAESFFLRNDRTVGGMNFWISVATGDADPPPPPPPGMPPAICPVVTLPALVWADSRGLIHRDFFRDCAPGRGFSTVAGQYRVFLHETGHSPFGLSDEYCCDGGYWQAAPFPNAFQNANPSATDCLADSGFYGGGPCRSWVDVRGLDWFTHDPSTPDLMVNNSTFNRLDIRRMAWAFNNCRFRSAC